MINPQTELHTAQELLQMDARRQTNLRRAVSTAYYSLFHFLGRECGLLFLGGGREELGLRRTMMRAFTHTEMYGASRPFASGNLPEILKQARPNPNDVLAADLVLVANNFRSLQQWRHIADYDHHTRFTKEEAVEVVDLAREAMEAWERVRGSLDAKIYLVALLNMKQLQAR